MFINLKRAFFLLILLPIFLILIFLFSGIKIDSFSFFGVKVSQFYIKLDKKLVLRVDNIEYKYITSKVEDSLEASKNDLTILPKVLMLFSEIDIKNLSINDNNFKIYLKDGKIDLDNKFVFLDAKLSGKSSKIFLDIDNLYLKDFKIKITGRAKLDYFNKELNYLGNIYYENIVLHSNIGIKNDIMKFFINSEEFQNLHFLKSSLNLPDIAETWMYDNVKGVMKLDSFYGEFNLNNYSLDINSLEGNATIKDAKVRYQEDLDEVLAKELKIHFKDSSLNIDLIDASYKKKELKNSFVKINNIADSEKGEVLVNIETKTALDRDILDILTSYNIKVPLEQIKGDTKAKLLISIPYSSDKKLHTKGEFITNNSTIAIGNFEFNSKKAEIFLKDTILEIKDANFIFQDMVEANTNLILDLSSLQAKGDADINRVHLDISGESIIDLKNKKSKLFMDFNDNVNISFEDLDLELNYDTKLDIYIKDLKKIYSSSKLLQTNSIKDGELFLSLYDKDKIILEASVSGLDLPIKRKGEKVSSLDIYGDITKGVVNISSKDDSLKLKIDKNLYIYLKEYEVIVEKSEGSQNSQTTALPKNMQVDLKNSVLNIFSKRVSIRDAKIKFDNNSNIFFEGKVRRLNLIPVTLKKNGNNINIFDIKGSYVDNIAEISTKNDDIKIKYDRDIITVFTKGYEILYNFPAEDSKNGKKDEKESKLGIKLNLSGENTNLVLDGEHRLNATKYQANITDNRKYVYIESDKTKFTYSEDDKKYFDIYLLKASSKFINDLANKQAVKDGSIDFYASGTINNLKGELFVYDSTVTDLSTINNILFFVQTSPALLNPLFAIPSALNINSIGHYEIEKGRIALKYSSNMNVLYLNDINIIGNGMDFEGNAVVNLNDKTINANLNLIFMKTYSNVVNILPVVNYILLGDNKRVESKIHLSGDLKDPKVESNFIEDSLSAPVNIIKRTITAPVDIFNNFIKKEKKEKEKDSKKE